MIDDKGDLIGIMDCEFDFNSIMDNIVDISYIYFL